MLQPVGVGEVEETVYLDLLSCASASIQELADRLALSRHQVASAVRKLEDKSLVHYTTERPPRIVAAPPDVALPALIQRREKAIGDVALAVEPLLELYRRSRTQNAGEELIELCVGQDAVAQRFQQLQLAAKEQVRLFVLPPYAVDLAGNDVELELLAQGVRYRAVYGADVLQTPDGLQSIQRYTTAGEQARVTSIVPTKLAVADGSLALLPLHSGADGTQFSAILVHPCGLLDSLIALFELIWDRSHPIDQAASVDAELSPDDRHLLSLLLTGLTDKAAGRALGMSERTVQRRVRAVMTQLDAETRLQLGARLRPATD
ncbi:MAG TPA: helix-turn-helix domain-containing protein [Nakamurella sp.]|nr:helix-turn-helix domain-containing protein [Nakamurella sp.]